MEMIGKMEKPEQNRAILVKGNLTRRKNNRVDKKYTFYQMFMLAFIKVMKVREGKFEKLIW